MTVTNVPLGSSHWRLVVIYAPISAMLGTTISLETCPVQLGRDSLGAPRDTAISRVHAEIDRVDGEYIIRDLGSTNGTFVNGERQASCRLRLGDHLALGSLILKVITDTDPGVIHEGFQRTLHDGLTGLWTRPVFRERFEEALSQSSPLTLLSLDLRHFKSFNDTFGHLAGDHVLRDVAHVLERSVPEGACVARVGGDVFSVLMSEWSEGEARAWPRRVLQVLENFVESHTVRPRPSSEDVTTTSSGLEGGIGIAMCVGAVWVEAPEGWDADRVLAALHHEVYEAKRAGSRHSFRALS